MAGYNFELSGERLTALPSGALWWQGRALLCVADLHLGKSERIARQGGALMPPYDTTETLARLRAVIDAERPEKVICLGDSFDDLEAERGLRREDYVELAAMMAGRHWIWIAGNHDPGPVEIAGTWRATYTEVPIAFRHVAAHGEVRGEVSGHYHPKHSVSAGGRQVTRPAFLVDKTRAILPAFGAYTGGLRSSDPVLKDIMGPGAIAVMTGREAVPVPL